MILAGRAINDGMAEWVAERLHAARGESAGSVLVLGLTFKEDVPDLRNSKVADLIGALETRGHAITVHDPHADPDEARHEYQIDLDAAALERSYDTVLLAVPHREYLAMGAHALRERLNPGGTLADLKGALESADWTL